MRGRRPTPTSLKVLAGNPGKRPLTPAAPFTAGTPEMPAFLTGEAAKEWVRLTALCDGLLAPSHAGILTVVCQHFATFRAADDFLKKHGEVYETNGPSGRLIRSYPQVKQRFEALKQYRLALGDLGLTPVAMSRVSRLASHEQPSGLRELLG